MINLKALRLRISAEERPARESLRAAARLVARGELEADYPRYEHRDEEEAREGDGLLEEHDTDRDRAERSDAGPHAVGRAHRKLLDRHRQEVEADRHARECEDCKFQVCEAV